MDSQIPQERIRLLNDATMRSGDYILYWMQSSHRTEDNPALTCAIERADRANLPLVVCFWLWPEYPEANLRHFRFMLEGLLSLAEPLASWGIRFVLRTGPPVEGVSSLAGKAALVVVDRGYLRLQQSWYRSVAARCRCPLVQVEGNIVVPAGTASQKDEYSAATFRPKVERLVDRFLRPAETAAPSRSSLPLDLPTLAGGRLDDILTALPLDSSVQPSPLFRGGEREAEQRFEKFLADRLDGYADSRNDPGTDGSSDMSPYLHFGQVSPVTLALRAREHGGQGAGAFLEELVVRRELAVNFVRYNDHYDSSACLPAWAKQTLASHSADARPYIYNLRELGEAGTHDPYWNAAQTEMVQTGRMHGYMRMYWGKKILEWSARPEDAYTTALSLNNRYELDGRDPNGYAGVAWCFGKHDRPWGERPVYGTVRSMTARGLERKFSMERYIGKVRRRG